MIELQRIAEMKDKYRAIKRLYELTDKASLKFTYPDLEARRSPRVLAASPTLAAIKSYFAEYPAEQPSSR
jgi:hypothetical protein